MKPCRRIAIFVFLLLLLTSAVLEGQELKENKIGYPAISYALNDEALTALALSLRML